MNTLIEQLQTAQQEAMTKRGIEIGNVNWQEMGNWSVFKPEGITLHMHIFGRAKSAITQLYGEAVKLPFRDTGFYDSFLPLNGEDIAAIQTEVDHLIATEKYLPLKP